MKYFWYRKYTYPETSDELEIILKIQMEVAWVAGDGHVFF